MSSRLALGNPELPGATGTAVVKRLPLHPLMAGQSLVSPQEKGIFVCELMKNSIFFFWWLWTAFVPFPWESPATQNGASQLMVGYFAGGYSSSSVLSCSGLHQA